MELYLGIAMEVEKNNNADSASVVSLALAMFFLGHLYPHKERLLQSKSDQK